MLIIDINMLTHIYTKQNSSKDMKNVPNSRIYLCQLEIVVGKNNWALMVKHSCAFMSITTTNLLSTLSPPPFNPNLIPPSLNKTRNALRHLHYHQAEQHATDTLVKIQQYQIVALLDMKAHALGMNGYLEKAIENAQDIITYAPHWSIGYLRLGDLLYRQGKRVEQVVKMYKEAVEKVSQEDPGYSQLVQLKNTAMDKNECYVDIIALLPLELVTCIFILLSETEKSVCFNVSRVWRQRMIATSATVWKTIYHDRYWIYKPNNIAIAHALPFIAENMQDLTLAVAETHIWLRYLNYMVERRFKMIKTLRIHETVFLQHFKNSMYMMSFISALWGMKNTLTTLDIRFQSYHGPLKLSELLFYCPKLTNLAITHIFSDFDTFFGDMDVLGEPRHTLVDVKFQGHLSSVSTIVPFFKYHPNIQRLRVAFTTRNGHGLDDVLEDILNMIQEHCRHLKILGYYEVDDVTTLEELQAYQRNCDYGRQLSSFGGIQEVTAKMDTVGLITKNFLQLVRNNAASLRRVHANMCIDYRQEANYLSFPYALPPIYPRWNFERLEHLVYCSDQFKSVESWFLHAIESCTTLKTIEIWQPSNLHAIVDTLTKMPPLEEFHLREATDLWDNDGLALEKFFKIYSEVSTPTSNRKLYKVSFHQCEFIKKELLDTIAAVETIKAIQFYGEGSFPSNQGLQEFLQKTGHRLVELSVYGITGYIDDSLFDIFSDMPHLEKLVLGCPKRITDQAVKNFVDHLPPSLRKLELIGYDSISHDTAKYVRRKMISASVDPDIPEYS
ncbi:hypothetical protein BDA99DRAFT_540240 [Phascolomyces articulosus]|uniref:F-box domain-containing protein n=1 Tax=Phascolomyces articulosus TaxID=60185 RepID=A0AAD5PB97_9FUNG|nr:hypothetical protein BDA99DRAFT_540240 [Phascolomyces articulosus]